MQLLAHYLNAIAQAHPEIINWRENYVNDSLFYSFRSTQYSRESFPSRLHYHDYYELVIYLEGDIHYICESAEYQPHYGDIILIPPHRLHMSVINTDSTLYRRHVFYFYPEALDAYACGSLLRFITDCPENQCLFTLDEESIRSLHPLLSRLDQALNKPSERDRALAYGLLIEIFYWLGESDMNTSVVRSVFPDAVLDIQHYIDAHFSEIRSVSDIASHFFYSREYVSRLFRRYFNTTVADYIMQRRVAKSQMLIKEGMALSEACFQAGFGSVSAFIRAFKAVTHMTPGQYSKEL